MRGNDRGAQNDREERWTGGILTGFLGWVLTGCAIMEMIKLKGGGAIVRTRKGDLNFLRRSND